MLNSLTQKPARQMVKSGVLRIVVLGKGGDQKRLHPSLSERMSAGKDKGSQNGSIILPWKQKGDLNTEEERPCWKLRFYFSFTLSDLLSFPQLTFKRVKKILV